MEDYIEKNPKKIKLKKLATYGSKSSPKIKESNYYCSVFFKKTVFWQFLYERHKIQIDLGA